MLMLVFGSCLCIWLMLIVIWLMLFFIWLMLIVIWLMLIQAYTLGVSPSLASMYCEGYRTLNSKFQKTQTKIEVVLSLPS